jgi:small-conductance mechanosensitive channel
VLFAHRKLSPKGGLIVLAAIQDVFHRVVTSGYMTQLARAICIAAVGELVLLLLNSRIRASLQAVLAKAAGEDATGRVRRRRIVLGIPLLLARTIVFTLVLLMIARMVGFRANFELYPVATVVLALILVGCRNVLRDAVRGYYLMYDHLYAPGDEIRIGELTGVVQDLGLRNTTMLTRDGREIVVPNGDIRIVTNLSRGVKLAER